MWERTGHRLLWSTTLLLSSLLSDSHVSISLVIHGLWWTVSGQAKDHFVLTCTNGVSPSHLPVIVASDGTWSHEPHCRHVPINKIWRRAESTASRSGWRRSHMAGTYSDCSTREILINLHAILTLSHWPWFRKVSDFINKWYYLRNSARHTHC